MCRAYAKVRINLKSRREAEIVYRAIRPETLSSPTQRSRAEIIFDENTLILMIEASDTTALRAAINSYLRWIMLIDETYKMLKSL